ncbi:hypothetical protein MMPV_002517 [Pyropia vietnamensis]
MVGVGAAEVSASAVVEVQAAAVSVVGDSVMTIGASLAVVTDACYRRRLWSSGTRRISAAASAMAPLAVAEVSASATATLAAAEVSASASASAVVEVQAAAVSVVGDSVMTIGASLAVVTDACYRRRLWSSGTRRVSAATSAMAPLAVAEVSASASAWVVAEV